MSANGTVKPKPRGGLAEEWVGQEVFLYDPSNGAEVHCLNSGAALVWLMCDGEREVGAIAAELAQEFGLQAAQTLAEVQGAVEQLAELELVEV